MILIRMPLILPILNSLMPINLLSIGPSFAPTPYNVNWCNLRQDVENFVNKIRFTFQNFINLQQSLQFTMTKIRRSTMENSY